MPHTPLPQKKTVHKNNKITYLNLFSDIFVRSLLIFALHTLTRSYTHILSYIYYIFVILTFYIIILINELITIFIIYCSDTGVLLFLTTRMHRACVLCFSFYKARISLVNFRLWENIVDEIKFFRRYSYIMIIRFINIASELFNIYIWIYGYVVYIW